MEPVKVTDEALLQRIIQHKKIQHHITLQPTNHNYRQFDLDHAKKDSKQRRNEHELWEHLGHTQILGNEIEQQYGLRASHIVPDNYIGPKRDKHEPQIIDTILTTRQQEYMDKLNTNATEFRYLLSQKEQIRDQRDKLAQMKQLVTIERAPIVSSMTDRAVSEPPPGEKLGDILPFSGRDSVQSVKSFIKATNQRLPADIEKYRRLRDDFEQRYVKLYKPYDGHLGPQSYESWQLADYHMVRGIVDGVVDKFLDNYFWKVSSHNDTETAHSILEADTRRWQTRRIQIIQATTIQLIMEEIVLQVTRRLAEETAEEFFYLYKFICDRSDVMFTKTAQAIAKSQSYNDVQTHTQVLNMLHSLQHDRDKNRLTIFSHSQPLDSKKKSQN